MLQKERLHCMLLSRNSWLAGMVGLGDGVGGGSDAGGDSDGDGDGDGEGEGVGPASLNSKLECLQDDQFLRIP
uniref:Uncharacterized protein n=1 Tax=Vespula pensylvanica TaxID=30213 RepID=A0A834KBY1_VESPE|nr:hypothetical protein H0235_015380 [Vespula pensylvanica]